MKTIIYYCPHCGYGVDETVHRDVIHDFSCPRCGEFDIKSFQAFILGIGDPLKEVNYDRP